MFCSVWMFKVDGILEKPKIKLILSSNKKKSLKQQHWLSLNIGLAKYKCKIGINLIKN